MPTETESAAGSVTETERRDRTPGPDRRLDRTDRRAGLDRRSQSATATDYTDAERRDGEERRGTGLERRRGPGRRLDDDRKSAEEGEMNSYQFEFVMAVQTYKRVNKRLYPTLTEILEVLQQLGYRKVSPRDFKLENVPEPKLETPDQD
jgi:hypothetical protein